MSFTSTLFVVNFLSTNIRKGFQEFEISAFLFFFDYYSHFDLFFVVTHGHFGGYFIFILKATE